MIPYKGEVTVSFTTIISSYCSIFGKYYPMDQHNCLLNFQYKVKGLNAIFREIVSWDISILYSKLNCLCRISNNV